MSSIDRHTDPTYIFNPLPGVFKLFIIQEIFEPQLFEVILVYWFGKGGNNLGKMYCLIIQL